ncbi:hypothetical protein [Streptomyces sp. NBC_00316]|uniref:hypothetical protein n=1 Tax=Streptomyces sp. NBC_00316 TaxID=2975710 RepID=UPI002E2AE835|nr:hypothetical protein [Streptomyces sp. NBC_00316]
MRRTAVVIGAVVLVGSAVPAAHAADDQGAPQYYDSGLAPTPYMGWNTYYGLGTPTEAQVKGVADYHSRPGATAAGTRGPPISADPRTGGSWERPPPTRPGKDASASWRTYATGAGWGDWSPERRFAGGDFDGELGAVSGPDGTALTAFRGVAGLAGRALTQQATLRATGQ